MKKYAFYISLLYLVISCKDSNSFDESIIPEPLPTLHTPVVFLHGFLASGDTYEKQLKRFTSNGYSRADLYAFDWNTLDFTANNVGNLNRFIDSILVLTGKTQVDLVGHSAGAGVVQEYTNRYRSKVKHLVLLAGFPPASQGITPILNIYSTYDFIASSGRDVAGGTNLKLTDKDHYEVATCKETFEKMYAFFNDGALPAISAYTAESDIILSGRAGSFGENKFIKNTIVEVYQVDGSTGSRINSQPEYTFFTNDKGYWGPFRADKNTYYEFVVYDNVQGSRKVHYYREPFIRSDKLIYLRTFPTGFSVASLFLSVLPKNDKQNTTVFFGASQAAIAGRDSLILNDNILTTNAFCSPQSTTIALFSFDANSNNRTDLTSVGAFSAFPFLKGADIYIPTATSANVTMRFNERTLRAKNWKSATEGVNVLVFE